MNGSNKRQIDERRKYVLAFNNTMVKIWKERITLLGAIDTGALYRSVIATEMTMDGQVTSITLSQSFRTYGIFVDRGTGAETPRGNPGDIGRQKKRQPKPWFNPKYYGSYMNITEFMADSLGRQFIAAMVNTMDKKAFDLSLLKS